MNKKKENLSIKKQVASKIEDITAVPEEEVVKKKNVSQVDVLDETHLMIENCQYEVVMNYRDAIQVEAIADRFNTILNKYDYVVGDWGYDQLRLKGFFDEENRRAPYDKKISFLEDYLYEYCNFGCAYFVLEKEKAEKNKKSRNRRKRKQENPNATQSQPANKPEQPQPKKARPQKPKEKQPEIDFKIKRTTQAKQDSPNKKTQPKESKPVKPNTGFQIHKVDE